MKVKVVEFSSDWKKDFENEKAVLAVVLTELSMSCITLAAPQSKA